LERQLGHDFSSVRVHTDSAATDSADALSAKAYALGDDIVFGPGRYQPHTGAGQRLLAHELAHVAQQQHAGPSASHAEPLASSAADRVGQGQAVGAGAVGSAPEGLYCDDDKDKQKEGKPWMPGSSLPNLQLRTPGPIDWLKMREPYDSHNQRLSLREVDSIEQEARRIADQLAVFGIGPNFKFDYKLGTLTRDDIVNLGIGRQLQDRFARENPNAWDRMNREFQLAHPGGWSTPVLSKTWKF
jgi:hypothetical protein